MKLLAASAALAALASQAPAATVDFATNGNTAGGTVAGGPLSYTLSASASGFLNNGASVTQGANGLGVNGNPDTNPGQIEGFPLFSQETLTVTFSWAVNLLSFNLGLLDRNDDYEISYNGGSFNSFGPGLVNPQSGQNNVTSFSIRASGMIFADGLGNDDFTLRSIEVASVPVPAAGLLLVGALGGLGALRRRKAA